MDNTKKSNDINRLEFLKKSGLFVAGVTLLPRFLSASPRDEKYNKNAFII